MKQVFIKKGNAVVEEVPAPCVEDGMVLVRNYYSCISAGTEMSSISNTAKPIWKRALEKPEEVNKALKMVAEQGVSRTRQLIEGRLQAGNPVGYSAAGVVLEVGKGVREFMPGDRVACAGTGYANHAEVIVVPTNLVVKVPESVELSHASTVALGAIALQGVRRADPTLGETVVVIGLGILGQLAAQILICNGCSVIGIDLDNNRGQLALDLGIDSFVSTEQEDVVEHVHRVTDGNGADAVIITAATSSHEVVSNAFKMSRKKGRVVLVGDVGLHLNRGDFYTKEIDFLISTSYGPGRYDSRYEEVGLDYPIGYIRWTERRNMSHFIQLLKSKKIQISPLVHKIFHIEAACQAYELLNNSKVNILMILLSYFKQGNDDNEQQQHRLLSVYTPRKKIAEGKVKLALIGAGGFSKGVHLPNISKLANLFDLSAVISRCGHNAKATAPQYKANCCGTDYREVLHDPEVDAVIITTRHNLHGSLTLEFLKEGKHVFVEKPLTLAHADLEKIRTLLSQCDQGSAPILVTGFNRRFSPHIEVIFERVRNRANPMIINYRMNAGHQPADHWVHSDEGGGRNLGEACHIYDLFTYLIGERVARVEVFPITPATAHYSSQDNFHAVLTFVDGSVASLTYTALGSREYPKELMEVYVDGKVMRLNDYKRTEFFGIRYKPFTTRHVEKGHMEELSAFGNAILHGGKWPIPLWQQLQATEIAFRVEATLTGQTAVAEI